MKVEISTESDELDAAIQDLAGHRLPTLSGAIDQYCGGGDKDGNNIAKQISWLFDDLDCPAFHNLRKIGDALRNMP